MPNVWLQVGDHVYEHIYIINLNTYSTNRLVLTSLVLCPPQKYVVTLVDHFSKWPEAAPLKDKTAARVALLLFETFCRYLTDLGKLYMEDLK